MGCGCGKKSVPRPAFSGQQSVTVPPNGDNLAKAQAYQSATMRPAPTGPVLDRKTV